LKLSGPGNIYYEVGFEDAYVLRHSSGRKMKWQDSL
jgi:hypothetical protein